MSSTPTIPHPSRPAAAPRVRCLDTGEWLALPPHLELGAGGEARVLAHPADPDRVVKLFHAPDAGRRPKLERMLADPPLGPGGAARGVRLAWPQALVEDEAGACRGFVMPRAEGTRAFELYNPVTRRTRAPHCDYALLHRAGWNLAAAFEALHAHGYVVGDVNESNVITAGDGSVALVDTDSFGVPDGAGGQHRCAVGKPEYTPPELQGTSFAEVDRGPEHDRFGLAVLLFQLLMEGTHPFAARFPGLAEAPPLAERIREGLFPYRGMWDLTAVPPRLAPPPEILHPGLRRLFHRCFVDGHADPAARPDPAEWRAALAEARAALVACDANPRHRFGAHLQGCPWCDRAALLGGRDPFPDTAADDEGEEARPAGWRPRMVPGGAPTPGLVTAPSAPVPGVPVGFTTPPSIPWAAAPVAAPAATLMTRVPQPPVGPIPQALAQTVHSLGLDSRWTLWSLGMTGAGLMADGGQQLLAALLASVFAVIAWNESGGLTRRQLGAGFAFGAAVAMLIAAYLAVISGMGAWADSPGSRMGAPPVGLEPLRPVPVVTLPVLEVDEGSEVVLMGRRWRAEPANAAELARDLAAGLAGLDGAAGTGGSALLSLDVAPDGVVGAYGVRVVESTDAALAEAATDAYIWARFAPPGVPVRVTVPVRWLDDAEGEVP